MHTTTSNEKMFNRLTCNNYQWVFALSKDSSMVLEKPYLRFQTEAEFIFSVIGGDIFLKQKMMNHGYFPTWKLQARDIGKNVAVCL